MKKLIAIITCLATVVIAGNALAQDSLGHSGQSLKHSGQSVIHSTKSVGHSLVAGAKLTSGVAAIPFKASGAVSNAAGYVSSRVGDDLWHTASGNAFELTDQNLTKAGLPPHQAIQN